MGRLTPDEWEIMQTHSALGAAALREMDAFRHLAPIVLHHHERYDGTGYPSRSAGENIPFGSRVIAVLDAYDALTMDRPYRTAQAMRAAGMELVTEKALSSIPMSSTPGSSGRIRSASPALGAKPGIPHTTLVAASWTTICPPASRINSHPRNPSCPIPVKTTPNVAGP